jgi:hypothetical protein
MARDTIFKCTQEMPATSNSSDVVRTALSSGEVRENYRPGSMPDPKKDVVNITRPVRGRPY